MKADQGSIRTITLVTLALIIGILIGGYYDRQVINAGAKNQDEAAQILSQFQPLTEAWKILRKEYVDPAEVNASRLVFGAIDGMVRMLDNSGHSRFLSPEMVAEAADLAKGQVVGIGAEFQMQGEAVVVVAPLDGGPAQAAGLRPGDMILQIDHENVFGLSLYAVAEKLSGQPGTRVSLTVVRQGLSEPLEVEIERSRLELKNVTWAFLPGTKFAHVRISAFNGGVAFKLKEALNSALRQGADGIILDLRNNPGGFVEEAVEVASQFLIDGMIYIEKNSAGKTRSIPVEAGGVAPSISLVVLINQGSASSSEIVAGALQDHERATLVGETTFGTGTILTPYMLPGGSALLIATQEWLTPSGRAVWHTGIQPDVEVALPLDATSLTPEAEKGLSPEALRQSGDTQLRKGLELLENN